jgi:hypothetical protein
MAFKEYLDKSSLQKERSRILQGGTAESTESRIGWWEREVFSEDSSDTPFTLTTTYSGKPDLVSYDFYGRNDLGWVILQYNNIIDVNTEFTTGSNISLPSKSRVFLEFLSKPKARRFR